MVTENYKQREFEFGSDYLRGSDLEDSAVKPKKKMGLAKKLVIVGMVAGGLGVGGSYGLHCFTIALPKECDLGGTWANDMLQVPGKIIEECIKEYK